MTLLLLGLVLFVATHSVRIVADPWRNARVAAMGLNSYKALYSLLSVAGLVLIVYGFGAARQAPTVMYATPTWAAHLAALLTIPAFILLAAAYVPGTRIKRAVGHPMVLGVKAWAFAHLISNGLLHEVITFGVLLAWSVLSYIAARKRDRAAGTVYVTGPLMRDVIAVVAGLVGWVVFALWLHRPLIGVAPFGG
ncbi:MAG: NnrU family protein [Burkholderiaceae bacterium]|nr:NnrU family protein [Burkholderiaceae bacterium]